MKFFFKPPTLICTILICNNLYVQAMCSSKHVEIDNLLPAINKYETLCPPLVPDYLEDFTSYLPNCWQEAGEGNPTTIPSDFGDYNLLHNQFSNGIGSNNSVNINLYIVNREDWLISPIFDLSGGDYELKYIAAITDFANGDAPEGNGMGSDDEVQVLITEDNGLTWTSLRTYNQSDFRSETGDLETIDLSAYSGNVRFAFWGTDGSVDDPEDYDFFIDEFKVRTPPPPANDNACDAIPLTVGAPSSGDAYTNELATPETDEPVPACFNDGINASVWFTFVAPTSGDVTVTTDIVGSTLTDTEIAVYDAPGDCSDMTTFATDLGCNQDGGTVVGNGWNSILDVSGLTPGNTYYIQVDQYSGFTTAGTFGIRVLDNNPPCPEPVNLNVTNITSTTVDLNWDVVTEATLGFEWFVFESGANPSTANPIDTNTAGTGVTTVTTNGLLPETDYDFYVSSDCDTNGTSILSSPATFTTDCAPSGLDYTEDFDSVGDNFNTSLNCWNEGTGFFDITENAGWNNQTFNNDPTNDNSNGTAMFINLFNSGFESPTHWVTSQSIDLGAGSPDNVLSYDAFVKPWSGDVQVTDMGLHKVTVVISADGGATWDLANTLSVYENANIPPNDLTDTEEVISLAGYSGVVKIGFYAEEEGATPDLRFYLDNVFVGIAPNNPYYHASTSVYNLSDSGDLFSSQLTEVELQLNDLKIAADGSTSTVFKFSGLDDYSDIGFKLKEPISSDPALHGIFDSGTVVNDTLKVTYTHPEYFAEPDTEFSNWKYKEYTIQIYNTQDDTIIEEYPIKIVRPSLLMVHGLWGTNSTFEEMEVNLMQQNTKMYDDFQTNRMSYIASISNNLNVGTLNAQKEVLKSKALQNNISAGKIDVLAHSNGGLLTRTYIQSDFFRNDINKFITFNTPHSGSQLANLVLEKPFLQEALLLFGRNANNGLVENLKVDSEFIEQLNGSGLQEYASNYSNTALHTLTTKDDLLPTSPNLTWDLYIFNAIKLLINVGINNYYSQIIFNNDNHDKIVAIESQVGGLPMTATSTPPFPDQYHVGSTKNLSIINKAIELLNQNPNNTSFFTKQGYNPVELSFSSNTNLQVQSTSTESVTINSPAEGASFVAGSTVNVDLTGTSGITDVLTAMGNQDIPLVVHETENNSSDNFQLTIPDEAIGRVEIVSSGFDANGFADNASTHIMVTTSAVLDSIQIEQDLIYTAEGQLGQFDVSGYYDDNVKRNITNLDNLQYAFTTGNAEFTENGLITGLNPGLDTLTVSYLGESSSVPITIASQDEWVQLELNTRIKTFLQGPYDANTGLMKDDLRSQNLIPVTSPYPDNRPAESGVFDAGGITGNGLPEDDIVDWVWVELRNENDPTIVDEAKSALLQRDGDIVEPDGFSRLSFYSPEGDYYIVVKHRNHLSIISQNPVSLSWYTADVDFTNGNMTAFGTNAQNVLSDGNLALWAGDVTNDGTIQYAGSTPESTSLLSFVLNDPDNFLNLPTHAADGYNNEDVNMDGITQYAGSDAEMPLILQNVLSNPLNFLNLISFPIEEQLPENVNN